MLGVGGPTVPAVVGEDRRSGGIDRERRRVSSQIGRRREAALEQGTEEYRERRQEIAKVAAGIFNQRGFRGTSMSAVAAAIGMDRASLYYYISSKEELFDEVVREVSEANVAKAEEIRAKDLAPKDKLRQLIVELMVSYGENYPLLYIYIRENLSYVAGDREAWSRHMRGLNRRYDATVIGTIEEGYADGSLRAVGPPRIVAYGIIGMIGWTNRWFRPQESDLTAQEIGTTFADMVLGGLGLSEVGG